MIRSRRTVIKIFGLSLALVGLLSWLSAKTPSRAQADFSQRTSQVLTSALPVASSLATRTPAGTQTFCNTGAITFNNVVPPATPPFASTPYPSNISVSGMTGTVSNVTVTLNNLSHTFPDDIDLLLVGPTGQKALIMSDAGGGPDAVNVTLTLDDAAVTALPDAGPLVSGTFKPSNFGVGDAFPAPAPGPPYGSTLSVFNVTDPNGTWSLYAVDDLLGDVGTLAGGWCLTITTLDTAPCVLTCPSDIVTPNDPTQCAAIVNYPAPTESGVCGTVTCIPPSGSFFFVGTTTVTCTSATNSTCSFTVTVQNVNCPTTFFCNPQSISMAADQTVTPYPAQIGVSGLSGSVSSVTVTLNNLTHTFPDDLDLLLVGPTGANAIIMSDVGGSADVNNITLTLDDAAATSLSDGGPLVSGTFKPTNVGVGDPFPAPAPAPLGGSALSVFNGTSPNGVWKLFVRDDSLGDAGAFTGGWCLTITTVTPCTITCPANVTLSNDPNQCGAIANYPAPTTTGDCGTVTCSPASGSFFPVGTTTVTCTTSVGSASCSFTVKVNDTQNPSVVCPANVTVPNDPGLCSATVNYPSATASDNCPGVVVSCSPPSGSSFPAGTTNVTCTATDASGNTANCSFTVTVTDAQPPTIVCPANVNMEDNAPGQCGALIDPGTPSAADNCGLASVVGVRSDSQPLNALYPVGVTVITWTATDTSGNFASCQQTITVTNPSPVVTITGPASGSIFPVNTSVSFTATFTDNLGDTHTAEWMFDAITQSTTVVEPTSSTPGTANLNYTFTASGVYVVQLKVVDDCGNTTIANTVNGQPALVVIFDPDGEFVTGGGWFNSPAGAYPANPTLTGKATFGFNAKYHTGESVPRGETEFKFGPLNFNSTSYDWLIIEGPRFQFKGSGKINNSGDYGFMVTGIDGAVSGGGGTDKIRFKIWDKNNGNAIVYDNQMGALDSDNPTTVLGGGNLVIHH